jgi:formate dehydrogenase
MLAMLQVIASEGLAGDEFLRKHVTGWTELRAGLDRVDLDDCVRRTGVTRDVTVALARRLAQSDRAVCYGRVGICRGPHATLANFLLTALNVVAGNFGRQGCATFATPILAGSDRPVPGGYGETRTRIGNFPSVTQFLASAVMPDDMLEPGPGQVRALLSFGGNVLLAAPGGRKLERALQQLELSVSFDLYVNEAGAYADYVLPGLTFYERADLPMMAMTFMVQPFIQYSEAIIPPVGEARSEFDVFCDLLRRMGLNMPAGTPAEKEAQRAGGQMRPIEILDLAIQNGPAGPSGASIAAMRDSPHGLMLDLPAPYGSLSKIGHADGRIHLWDSLIEGEFERLFETESAARDSLKLITRRDIRSHNGWMHNVDRLIRSQEPRLRIHPLDATRRGLSDGDQALLSNQYGEVRVRIEITDEMLPGVVAYPHCFGHGTGSWKRANESGGVNINVLIGHGPDVIERISGTTIMDGISVQLSAG